MNEGLLTCGAASATRVCRGRILSRVRDSCWGLSLPVVAFHPVGRASESRPFGYV